jgi:hypothetical protein
MAQPESYSQIKADVLRFLHNQSIEGRVQAMVLDLVNQALRTHPIVLSNQEKNALTHDVMKDILLGMLEEYQDLFNQN